MNWRKWLDGFSLSTQGILLVSKKQQFWYGFVPAFLFFALIMNLLSGGLSKFELMGALGFPDNLGILWENFLGIFGINRVFGAWFIVFLLSTMQGTLIGLIVFLWKKKSKNTSENSENIEKAGIITGLIALGAGCPTCGTTLITPLLGTIFSTGGLAATEIVSTATTWIAIIIAILSLKRLGEETYVVIIAEKRAERLKKLEKNAKI